MILTEHKAKDFFNALESGETKYLLVENHKEVFEQLYDEFFEKRNDQNSLSKIKGAVRIEGLKHKLAFLNYAYTVIDEIPLNARHILDVENALSSTGIQIDLSKPKEALDLIKRNINVTENLIEMSKDNSEDKKVTFDFTSTLVAFENIMGFAISEDVSIAKFLAYEKQMINKINESKKKK